MPTLEELGKKCKTATGMVNSCEFDKLELEAIRKRNELLDLEIEAKKIDLKFKKLALELETNRT